ncbi:MAG: aldehyde ferredoxin oxidoreductase family protein, partial [Chloroflexi bacterium]|nr:aldehyde ferredoxin oxidoreductase family protein [Chloroflexota bacterium]
MQPILKVDLSTEEVSEYDIPYEWENDFIGGASLAARILYEYLTQELDPFSEESPLLFLNGPMSGTSGPTVSRFVVCGKSPATGLWAESNCGGFWGVELRKTGYDGIWVTGKAKSPKFLWINDGNLEIRSSEKFIGLDTYEIQEAIKEELNNPKVKVAGIGIAGENLIPSALILTDHGRVAGRTGLGAVMGSKNLKAIAVKGSKNIPVANEIEYKKLRSRANQELNKDNITKIVREMGTAASAEYFDYLGTMPKKYYRQGVMEGADNISGATISDTILTKFAPCHACVVACGRVVKISGADKEQKGPEYETLVGFGPNLLISDAEFVTRMGDLCDRFGMDTISVSNTLGLAFTLFELGHIAEKDTDGLQLNWGDKEVVEQLIPMIAKKIGFGAFLAEGALALGRRFGAEDEAVQVNGLELAYHDPRGVSGMALVYATSPRGGCHNQSDYFLAEIGKSEESLGIKNFDRQAGAEKAENVAIHQNYRTMANALVICFFGSINPELIVDLTNAACGLDLSIADYLEAGERAWNLKRAINNNLGLRRENDRLPKSLLEPLSDGGAAGYKI